MKVNDGNFDQSCQTCTCVCSRVRSRVPSLLHQTEHVTGKCSHSEGDGKLHLLIRPVGSLLYLYSLGLEEKKKIATTAPTCLLQVHSPAQWGSKIISECVMETGNRQWGGGGAHVWQYGALKFWMAGCYSCNQSLGPHICPCAQWVIRPLIFYINA